MLRDEDPLFDITGSVKRVVTCATTAADLAPVPPRGFGVGASGIGKERAEVARFMSDSAFVFGSAFVSELPLPTQRHGTAASLQAEGLEHFAAVMTSFDGGVPDFMLQGIGEVSQSDLLAKHVWPKTRSAAAVGVVALVRLRREHVSGALIAVPITSGAADLGDADSILEDGVRSRFFELDPLRYWQGFQEGYAWLVATSIRAVGPPGKWDEVYLRFSGSQRPSVRGACSHHCHLLLVDEAPSSWLDPLVTNWQTLARDGEEIVAAGAERSFVFHSNDVSIMTPLRVCAWGFSAEEVVLL